MNFRKRIALMLALACLTMLLSPAALAWTPRYPEQQGLICDSAAVLSPETVSDLDAFNRQLADGADRQLAVVTVDFLDGATPEAYCDGLRKAWNLPEDTALLLLAVGEDRFTLDGTLGLESRVCEKLLSAHLEGHFMAQDYDSALRSFIPALSQELNKTLDADIDLGGLFGQEAPSAVSVDDWAANWLQRWEDEPEEAATPIERFVEEDERSGFSLGKVILTIFLLMVIFGNSGRSRRYGRDGCGCSGCGCAPFSSLLAGLGLWRLWGGDHHARR